MGRNIPRPSKRSKTLNVDAIYGALTVNEIRKRYGLDPVKDIEPEEISKPIERSPFNCPNCCAPIVKDYCEYCGTRFGFSVVKVDGFKKREDIERLKKAWSEKEILFADNKVVAEFARCHETAYNLGVDAPKLPIKKQR